MIQKNSDGRGGPSLSFPLHPDLQSFSQGRLLSLTIPRAVNKVSSQDRNNRSHRPPNGPHSKLTEAHQRNLSASSGAHIFTRSYQNSLPFSTAGRATHALPRREGEILARDVRNLGNTLEAISTADLSIYLRSRLVRDAYWSGVPEIFLNLQNDTSGTMGNWLQQMGTNDTLRRSHRTLSLQLPSPTIHTASALSCVTAPWPSYAPQLRSGLRIAGLSLDDIAALPVGDIDRTRLVDGVRYCCLWKGIWNRDLHRLFDAFDELTLYQLFELYPPGSVPDHFTIAPSRRRLGVLGRGSPRGPLPSTK